MSSMPVLPKSGNTTKRTGALKAILYLLQEQLRNAISLSRSCGQTAVIVEVTFAQPARTKPLLACNERPRIERGRAEIDQFAINKVADFDRSDRLLRDICYDANVNWPIFAPIIVNEDRAAVAVDLARPVAHAHTY